MAPPTIGFDQIAFHVHWDVVGLVAALAIAYGYAIRRLGPLRAPSGKPAVTRRQIAWFAGGLLVFLLARSWPLHDIGDQSLFLFHMIEHLLLALVVPPMLLLGTPTWLMQMLVAPILPVLRVLTRPLVALLLFNGVLAYIHAPGVVALMLHNEAAHLGLHLALMVAATLMWWPIVGPIPEIPKLTPFMAMGYLFLQSLVPTIPASFLTFASTPVYPVYSGLPRLWGLSVIDDQLIAGLIMKIGGGLFLWTLIATIWFKWAAADERTARRGPVIGTPSA
ncbi:MAG: cytochrome c oxidase assembly protein [Actinobacteria bacterium]|nr:cytochrome c oxidase assembly protein [Actinomycetota bacterium]